MKYSSTLKGLCALVLLLNCQFNFTFAQCDTHCSVSCSGQINLSLGDGCEAEVTAWMGGKGVPVGSNCYAVEVFDAYNNLVPGNIVDINHVNQLLTYKVIELECNNYCWGNVLVEYKQGPQLACPPDMTMDCNALEHYQMPEPVDLCAAVSIDLIKEDHLKLECDELYQAVVTRTYKAVDAYGNTNTCSHDIYLKRVNIYDITFPGHTILRCSDENILYDVNGFPVPGIYDYLEDSLDVIGLPIICSADLDTGYVCTLNEDAAPALVGCGAIEVDLGDTGAVLVDVNDAGATATLPCSNQGYFLSLSDSDSSISGFVYNCSDVGVTTYTAYLYNGTAIVAQCSGTLTINDPMMICSGGGTGSGTGSGTPGGGIPPVTTGPTTTSGTGNLGTGDCQTYYGIPLIPDGGGVILTEKNDPNKPYQVNHIEDSNASYLCGAVLLYNDVEFASSKNTCKRKIFRTWEVYEWWCHEELNVSSVQIIEIKDDMPPVFNCPSHLTISTNNDCASSIQMPPINAFDQCGTDVTISMQYHDGHQMNTVEGDGGLVDLNAGENTITYTVTDACRNSSSCTVAYTVIDYTNPVAICEQEKVISLGTNAYTSVPASIFDLGSYDDCEIDLMQVRRQDATCHDEADKWGDYAYFCCADAILGEVPVEFRVTDKGGNSSNCIVYVQIQDKANPIVNCPPDMTIDCREAYNDSDLGAHFGYGTMSDNCTDDLPLEEVTTDYDQCGVGVMTRTMKVLGANGSVLASCQQFVTITNADPFTADDIIWPEDFVAEDICDVSGLDPEFLDFPFAYPTYVDGSHKCALLGYDYEDQVFTADPSTGECAVIQRTWTVVNWCGTPGSFDTYLNPIPQIIKIKNTIAPVMDQGAVLVFTGQDVDCNSGQIDVTRTAVDDCDNSLFWEFTIKRTYDGAIVHKGNSNSISGKFPVGDYHIEWRVTDGCGNSDFHIQSMQIISNKPPTPVCHNGLSATLIGWDTNGDGDIDTEQVELWASEFNAGSYPNCGNEMTFSFSSDVEDTNIIFDCNDLGRNNVEMWVTDLATRAQAYCIAFIDIQDQGDCPDQNIVTVAGQVMTEVNAEVEDVEVYMALNQNPAMTDQAGAYAFPQMPAGGSYEIQAEKDINYLEGVSTLDLIMIQRHILGIESLDSPYKIIAADANDDQSIDGVDLIELRKLVLGIYKDLPRNDSWRFVSSDYVFSDPYNPWLSRYDETYRINSLNTNMVVDFIGVKIGDVNNTVSENLRAGTSLEGRNKSTVVFNVNALSLEAGETGSLVFYSDDYQSLRGWQVTLELDNEVMEVVDVKAHGLDVTLQNNFNLGQAGAGRIAISYHQAQMDDITENQPLFELIVKAKSTISEDLDLAFTSSLIQAEAYDSDNNVLDLKLSGQSSDETLWVNISPNPFINKAEITYQVPTDEVVVFDFFDVNGRMLHTLKRTGVAGKNSIKISREDFDASGIIYLRMRTRNASTEYRMLLL